jgi:uncharacterized protein YoxC
MTISETPFVPTDEIRRVTTGSYEHLIARIEEAVGASSTELFGAAVKSSVVGTFSDHALVLAEDGRCVRVSYSQEPAGVKILSSKAVAIRSFQAPTQYLKDEVGKAVDCFLKGSKVEAAEKFKTVARLVETSALTSDDKLAEGVSDYLQGARTWKTHYQEHEARFKTFLGDATLQSLVAGRAKTRFAPLYEEGSRLAESDDVRGVVTQALHVLADRVDTLREDVEKSVARLTLTASQVAVAGESQVLTALDSFAQDLAADLRSVHKVVVESSQQVSRTDCLARIHDSVTQELHQYEVAARFVVEMTQSLVEATKPKP